MATVTITFKDKEDGGVDILTEFTPQMKVKKPTRAQILATEVCNALSQSSACVSTEVDGE